MFKKVYYKYRERDNAFAIAWYIVFDVFGIYFYSENMKTFGKYVEWAVLRLPHIFHEKKNDRNFIISGAYFAFFVRIEFNYIHYVVYVVYLCVL